MKADLAYLAVQALLKYGPIAARGIVDLFKKDEPTVADIEALIARVEALDFDAERNAARRELSGT